MVKFGTWGQVMPFGKLRKLGTVGALVASMIAGSAHATDLVFSFTNPSFGGSALNSSHLLATANAQREATARDADDGNGSGTGTGTADEVTDADLFVRQLEGRLLSALAGQVTEAIFGDTPSESGTVTFGSTEVTFERSLEAIRLVITDSLDGTVTEIVVPQLVTDAS